MQCCTSMNGAFEAAGMLGNGRELALVGGVESMSCVQFGLGQNLSVWLRRPSGRPATPGCAPEPCCGNPPAC